MPRKVVGLNTRADDAVSSNRETSRQSSTLADNRDAGVKEAWLLDVVRVIIAKADVRVFPNQDLFV
jgi:hypothetical protein